MEPEKRRMAAIPNIMFPAPMKTTLKSSDPPMWVALNDGFSHGHETHADGTE
jgi:hypothetical protein